MSHDEELVTVRIVGLPLVEQTAASEHFDDLIREFALLSAGNDSGGGIPARLIELRDRLVERFQTFTQSAIQLREAAIDRGDTTVDLSIEIPRSAGDAARELRVLLADADEYCRSGAHLLTLETPPQLVTFREWYLGEFVRQVDGREPMTWTSYIS